MFRISNTRDAQARAPGNGDIPEHLQAEHHTVCAHDHGDGECVFVWD